MTMRASMHGASSEVGGARLIAMHVSLPAQYQSPQHLCCGFPNPAAVCKHGNLLLCTLLLGNTVINSAISIILSSVTNGAVGLLVSTFVILLLGE